MGEQLREAKDADSELNSSCKGGGDVYLNYQQFIADITQQAFSLSI